MIAPDDLLIALDAPAAAPALGMPSWPVPARAAGDPAAQLAELSAILSYQHAVRLWEETASAVTRAQRADELVTDRQVPVAETFANLPRAGAVVHVAGAVHAAVLRFRATLVDLPMTAIGCAVSRALDADPRHLAAAARSTLHEFTGTLRALARGEPAPIDDWGLRLQAAIAEVAVRTRELVDAGHDRLVQLRYAAPDDRAARGAIRAGAMILARTWTRLAAAGSDADAPVMDRAPAEVRSNVVAHRATWRAWIARCDRDPDVAAVDRCGAVL